MLFQNLVLLLTFIITTSYSQTTQPELCATGVHAILIRGQGPGDHLNVMVTMQNLILQLIPGSSSVALPYHHGGDDHRVVAADGALLMQQYIRDYVASCPHSRIFIMGYSLGGIIMMDGLCGTSSLWLNPVSAIEPQYNKNVIAAAAYGEETFIPGMPWNAGTCADGTGVYPRLHPEYCDPYASSIRDYCDEGDSSCCMKYPAWDDGSHFTYIFKYNVDLLRFVERRLAETPVP
ncbi:hypothetical protein N7466_011396 [Penicillium verhagenii]|uniref:uncharacterized protein n=1 Tax=Penicillium verhagenii TaxID=1562060 RepID=UPI0025456F11|nr:uncharacterized protein N7466_011396 [Penicillium verhagenii]KAJ5915463.1 hypothetical protein N7466_011396 [Penicillium verhagenii]